MLQLATLDLFLQLEAYASEWAHREEAERAVLRGFDCHHGDEMPHQQYNGELHIHMKFRESDFVGPKINGQCASSYRYRQRLAPGAIGTIWAVHRPVGHCVLHSLTFILLLLLVVSA
jgi:hypothetical protein